MLIGKPARSFDDGASGARTTPDRARSTKNERKKGRKKKKRNEKKEHAEAQTSRSGHTTTASLVLPHSTAHPPNPLTLSEKDKKLIARDHSFSPHPCINERAPRVTRALSRTFLCPPTSPRLISARRTYAKGTYMCTSRPEIGCATIVGADSSVYIRTYIYISVVWRM